MTLDGFLTFLALVVAIFALVPRVIKLRARLVLPIHILIAVVALLLVLYLHFFSLARYLCVAIFGGSCEWLPFPTGDLITHKELSFLVVLSWMVLALLIYKFFSRLRASFALPTISRMVNELVYQQRFADIIDLVEPYLPLIDQTARRKLILHPETQGSAFSKKLRRWVGKIAMLIPAKRQAENAAIDIARLLFRSIDFRDHIVPRRPYFGIPLLKLEVHEKRDFSYAYFGDLISDTGSVLYEELNQDWNGPYIAGRGFLESNRLLYFLFDDARTAKELSVWKPIGEYLLKLLRTEESPDPDFLARLNKGTEDFDEERWENPFSAGIYFFELMVTAAALQGVRWHMWLYYFPMFVERLEEQYDKSDPSVNSSAEFPTRSARLIYEALCTLRNWVLLASELSPDSPHKQFENLPGVQGQRWRFWYSDSKNIPVSAAIALGRCMGTIALSDRLDDEFSGYMYKVILRTIERLGHDNEVNQLRSFLIQSIIHGGQNHLNHSYGLRLAKLESKVDHVIWGDIKDYKDALNQTYPNM